MTRFPFFTIITPTVQRQSLLKTCESINQQTFNSWSHVVMVDCAERDEELLLQIQHPQRLIFQCSKPHRNGGNTCRHNAWQFATGTYIHMLDDDNYLSSPRVLEDIGKLLEVHEPEWGLFPIFRHGSVFYFDPPKPCFFDTGNAVVRRGIARWPDVNDYASDAVWLEKLLKHPYKAFPDAQPIMVMPTSSFGEGGGINGNAVES